MRVQLPSGGIANVSPDVKPETLKALDEMLEAARRQMKPQSTKIGFYIYRGKDGFRWRCVHRNGNIIAESGEGYQSKRSLKRTLENFTIAIGQNDMELFDQTK